MERERDRPLACKFPGQSGKPVRIADFQNKHTHEGQREKERLQIEARVFL